MKERGQDVTFFDDKRLLTNLAFLVDITQHLETSQQKPIG